MMPNTQVMELRRETRKPVDLYVLYRRVGENKFLPAKLENVSLHGLFMKTDDSFFVGEELEIIISPEKPDYEPMQVTVEVVRIQTSDNDRDAGYGCKVTSTQLIENIAI
jgi:Tfp pilus assembly protein PilZ